MVIVKVDASSITLSVSSNYPELFTASFQEGDANFELGYSISEDGVVVETESIGIEIHPVEYSIAFHMATGSSSDDILVDGCSILDFQVPSPVEREGLLFAGWFSDTALNTRIAGFDPSVTDYYAGWADQSDYFAIDSAKGTMGDAGVEGYGFWILPEVTAFDGYRFLGWSADGLSFAPSGIVPIGNQLTALFKSEDVSCTLTYVIGDEEEAVDHEIGDLVYLRTPVSDSGKEFVGWSIDGNAVGRFNTLRGDTTVIAVFSDEDVQVRFVAGDGVEITNVARTPQSSTSSSAVAVADAFLEDNPITAFTGDASAVVEAFVSSNKVIEWTVVDGGTEDSAAFSETYTTSRGTSTRTIEVVRSFTSYDDYRILAGNVLSDSHYAVIDMSSIDGVNVTAAGRLMGTGCIVKFVMQYGSLLIDAYTDNYIRIGDTDDLSSAVEVLEDLADAMKTGARAVSWAISDGASSESATITETYTNSRGMQITKSFVVSTGRTAADYDAAVGDILSNQAYVSLNTGIDDVYMTAVYRVMGSAGLMKFVMLYYDVLIDGSEDYVYISNGSLYDTMAVLLAFAEAIAVGAEPADISDFSVPAGTDLMFKVVSDEGTPIVKVGDTVLEPIDSAYQTYRVTVYSDTTITAEVSKSPDEPAVYSTDIRAALRTDDDGVYVMLIALDDKAIGSGTVDVTYSYTAVSVTPFGMSTVLQSGTVSVDYESTGKAYAYIPIDFAEDARALAVYDDIVGARAVYSDADGDVTAAASTIAFTLPARA